MMTNRVTPSTSFAPESLNKAMRGFKYSPEMPFSAAIWSVTAGFLFGLLVGMGIDGNVRVKPRDLQIQYLKKEAITHGYAEYNPTNGVWQWKIPLTKTQ